MGREQRLLWNHFSNGEEFRRNAHMDRTLRLRRLLLFEQRPNG